MQTNMALAEAIARAQAAALADSSGGTGSASWARGQRTAADRPRHSGSQALCADTGGSYSPEASDESDQEDATAQHAHLPLPGNWSDYGVTTLIVGNVPTFLTQGALVSQLEDLTPGMRGAFDLFYCPWDPNEELNLGFAIINFFVPEKADEFKDRWAGQCLLQGSVDSAKFLITPAGVQGSATNLSYLSGVPLAKQADPRFRPLVRLEPNGRLWPMALAPPVAGPPVPGHGQTLQPPNQLTAPLPSPVILRTSGAFAQQSRTLVANPRDPLQVVQGQRFIC